MIDSSEEGRRSLIPALFAMADWVLAGFDPQWPNLILAVPRFQNLCLGACRQSGKFVFGADVPRQAREAVRRPGGLVWLNELRKLKKALLYREMVSRRAPHGWRRQNVHPLKAFRHI